MGAPSANAQRLGRSSRTEDTLPPRNPHLPASLGDSAVEHRHGKWRDAQARGESRGNPAVCTDGRFCNDGVNKVGEGKAGAVLSVWTGLDSVRGRAQR